MPAPRRCAILKTSLAVSFALSPSFPARRAVNILLFVSLQTCTAMVLSSAIPELARYGGVSDSPFSLVSLENC